MAGVSQRKIALLFAGQGAQHPGMGQPIHDASEAARAVFDAAESVRPDIRQLCFGATAEELALTRNTQPAVFTVDLACAAALTQAGVSPACVAGFSLGELAALTYAGVFSTADGFACVARRAQLMDEACERAAGCMVAVLKLDPSRVEEIAREVGDAWPVNYNSPQQTVVACREEARDRLVAAVKQAGGRAMPLAVSGAFHSPLMADASMGLLQHLTRVKMGEARVPVWANATAAPYPAQGCAAMDLLARQMASPVLWTQTLERMAQDGVDAFVEVGPGRVLTGLVKRTLPDALALSVETPDDVEAAVAALEGADNE